ncbi:MAG TPA: AmmeMemoRadiSam system protein A [Thermoplasmata archaeon]|nr:AmmeMemoRadiSam system protein A [Thermoplasmata archaeon]HUJ78566.1 AmmeMemoRadiSam system protein A [Thermoplasmata archaeon]
MVTAAEAGTAIGLARRAIGERFRGADADPAAATRGERLPPVLDERRGVFVTLVRHPSGALRGCIGYPLPVHALRIAIPRVAVAAAFDDPRFPPLAREELPTTRVELSLLTVPEPIPATDPDERALAVRVGVDGLVLERGDASGLLLPQVAVAEEWDSERFLRGVATKAGLPASAWRDPAATLYRFQAEVFAERSPGGTVEPVPLDPTRR